MTRIEFDTVIDAPAERVFAVLVDLPGYSAWLPHSKEYAGTAEISTDPVGLGTTYVEPSPSGTRVGRVVEFSPPSVVAFEQPMTLRPGFLGTIGITVRYRLEPLSADRVHVFRTVTVTLGYPVKLLGPLVVRRFRGESRRTLAALQGYTQQGLI